MIQRDDLPETPDWSFTKPEIRPDASLPMPLLYVGDQA